MRDREVESEAVRALLAVAEVFFVFEWLKVAVIPADAERCVMLRVIDRDDVLSEERDRMVLVKAVEALDVNEVEADVDDVCDVVRGAGDLLRDRLAIAVPVG